MPSPKPTTPPPPLTEEQRTQTLSPSAEPLLVVAYGRMHPTKGYPKLDGTEAPPQKARLCLQQALKLAEALILHPLSLQVATRIFTPSSPDNPLVERAIRAALNEMRIAIFIDRDAASDGPAGMFGKHCRPQQTSFNKTMAESIFITPWREYVERLMPAFDERGRNARNYERHLFLTANGLAHELIHLLRSQVFFRLRGSGLHVAYETPSKSLASGGTVDGAAEFEDAVLGGVLCGGWLRDRSPGPAEKNTPDVTTDVATLAQLLASNGHIVSLGGEQAPMKHRNDPFDVLILGRYVDDREQNYGIKDSWIHNVISAFEDVGNINSIAFPPTITPEPLPPWEYTRISVRPSKPRDVIRSYEIGWPEGLPPGSAERSSGQSLEP